MSGTLRVAQDEWVERVLGVRPTAAAPKLSSGDFRRRWQQSYAAWQSAIAAVDEQMAALGAECRKTEDPWLIRIADLGLPAVTGNHRVPLMAACRDVSAASDDKLSVTVAKARQAIAAFAKHIATNEQVAGCDANPFGVKVSIRATLGPALTSLNNTLRLFSA